MQLDKALYRDGIVAFAVVTAIIVWGFWPGHYAHPRQPLRATRYHVHGILMTAWLAMLLSQAYLIRSNRRAIHRMVGKASYVLAPLIRLRALPTAIRRMRIGTLSDPRRAGGHGV